MWHVHVHVQVRCLASDFSVALAIVLMSAFDALVGVDTPKLNVPHEFRPTSPTRGWLVPPLGGNPWWTVPLAFPPALLCCVRPFCRARQPTASSTAHSSSMYSTFARRVRADPALHGPADHLGDREPARAQARGIASAFASSSASATSALTCALCMLCAVCFAEGIRLPPRPVRDRAARARVLGARPAVVRGRHRAEPEPREEPAEDEHLQRARRDATEHRRSVRQCTRTVQCTLEQTRAPSHV